MRKKYFVTMLLLSVFTMACSNKNIDREDSNNENEPVIENAIETNINDEDVNEYVRAIISNKYSGTNDELFSNLEKLGNINPYMKERMVEILEYWDMVNAKDFVNLNDLPDGLPSDDSLCIVVMGYCLNPDGSMKDELIGRLETALNAANKYPSAYILVSGGGTAANNPGATEADCMAGWLMDNGISKDRIIIENKSMTSGQNAILSYEIVAKDYKNIEKLVIVTSDYHVPLGCLLYNAEFIYRGSNIRVISNAAFETGKKPFDTANQTSCLLGIL